MKKPYLVYIYESGGLRPSPPGRDDPIASAFAPPGPTKTTAFRWIAHQLRTSGTDMNALYDGVIIIVSAAAESLSETIIWTAAEYGFVPLAGDLSEDLRLSLKLGGFDESSRGLWTHGVMIDKDAKALLGLADWVEPLMEVGYTPGASDNTGHLHVSKGGAKLGWVKCSGGIHYFEPVDDPALLEEQRRLASYLIARSPKTASDELRAFEASAIDRLKLQVAPEDIPTT